MCWRTVIDKTIGHYFCCMHASPIYVEDDDDDDINEDNALSR